MGMKYLALAMVLVGGCGRQVGPSAEATHAAMQIAWGNSMAMEMNAAPVVIWLDAGPCDHTLVDEPQGTLSDLDNCVEDSADSRGVIEVVWRGSFSGSKFSKALAKYRSWLMRTDWNVDPNDVDASNRALVAAGM